MFMDVVCAYVICVRVYSAHLVLSRSEHRMRGILPESNNNQESAMGSHVRVAADF
jgi:hypothetical protein